MAKKIIQTAGKDSLGEFASEFAHYNDDILFGENWNDGSLDTKTRCILTVSALISMGITDTSLVYHMNNAKNNGVSKTEMAGIITHLAFYVGWPKAWAAFNLAKEIYKGDDNPFSDKERFQKEVLFPIGEPNDKYAKYFIGQSYLYPVSLDQVRIANVTFEPRCRNNWHIHHAKTGGGQMLICIGGRGLYQEEGKEAVELLPGKVVHIPPETKHWHGAAKDSWMAHLAFEVEGEEQSTEWCEPVSEEEYEKLD